MSLPSTIPNLILSACARPELNSKPALSMATGAGPGEALTYGDLARAVASLAFRLRRDGLSPGERVALMSENGPLWAAAYVGVLGAGGACVPIDAGAREVEVKEILGHSGARILIHSERAGAVAREAAEEVSGDIALIPIEEMSEISEIPRGESVFSKSDPDAEAVVIYTSGTTGRPKGVRLSHKNIVTNVVSMKTAVSVHDDDVFLSVLPLNHTLECTAGLLLPLSVGASVAYAPSLRPRELREAIILTKPTVMLGVPLLYEKLLDGIHRAIRRSPPAQRLAGLALVGTAGAVRRVFGAGVSRWLTSRIRRRAGLDRVRYMISGAAAIRMSVSEGFETLGITLIQGYGLTEASPVVTVNPPEDPRAGTVGVALPGVEISIDDPGPDGVGELLAKGDNIMLGYLRDSKATAEVLSGKWLRTGDLGWIDPDGYLRITGRRKNVIVTSAGKNVYPEEVEALLLRSHHIKEAIVVGRRPAKGLGEQPWAIVFPNRDEIAALLDCLPGELKTEQIREAIRDEVRRLCSALADYKKVRGFTIREEEFPRTSTNKIKRYLFDEQQTLI